MKKDRELWLQSLAESGSWADIKKLRKPPRPAQGRLEDIRGKLIESDQRAEAMAEYLEKIQWRVRPDAIITERP